MSNYGERDSPKGVFSPQVLAGMVARTCKDGCTYLRGRLHVLARTDAKCRLFPQTFAGTVAMQCRGGCKRLRERLQCFAGAVANVCGNGCNALRLRWTKLAQESPVVFWIRKREERRLRRGLCSTQEMSTEPLISADGWNG